MKLNKNGQVLIVFVLILPIIVLLIGLLIGGGLITLGIINQKKVNDMELLTLIHKKNQEEKNECWYNSTHEDSFGAKGEPLENVVGGTGLGGAYMSSSKANRKL